MEKASFFGQFKVGTRIYTLFTSESENPLAK